MRSIRLITGAGALLAVASCLPASLPKSAPRTPVGVNASFDRTFDAAVGLFGEWNIEVNQDRAGGIITSTNAVQIPESNTHGEDCPNNTPGMVVRPQFVRYRVVVTGDSTMSSIVAFALYTRMPDEARECASRGTWETQVEGEVKRRAEQR